MQYIRKIDYYLKILTDEKVKDFVAINFKSIREHKSPRKIPKSIGIFLTAPDEIEKYVKSSSSDNSSDKISL